MSTKDDALIADVARAISGSGVTSPASLRKARAALAVARKAILEEAERAILDKAAKLYAHAKAPYLECAEVVRSISTQD